MMPPTKEALDVVYKTDFVRAANSTLRSIERTLNVTTGARLESAAEIAATPEAEPLLQVVTSAGFLSVLASVWCVVASPRHAALALGMALIAPNLGDSFRSLSRGGRCAPSRVVDETYEASS